MGMKRYDFKPWEIALCMALAITLSAALWAEGTQRELSDRMIRLHVIANSDSEADQAAKLAMRDRVLETLAPILEGCQTREEAAARIEESIPALEALGGVTVTLGTESYPTRDYDTFSLPAGEYLSLRIVMGEGKGHNWWCVVFPPLCTELLAEDAASEDAFLSLDGEQAALITREDEEYELRFRIVDWWGQIKRLVTPAA